MSERNLRTQRFHQAESPVFTVDVSAHDCTGGMQTEPSGFLESVMVWSDPVQKNVVLSFNYEDRNTRDLERRWYCLNPEEARRLATALLNATDPEFTSKPRLTPSRSSLV